MIETGSSGVLLGLASAFSWGTSDFTGGFATKRGKVYAVLMSMKGIGVFVWGGLALLTGEVLPAPESLLWAALAGTSGVLGLVALYTGLARGRMGIIAPLSALVTGAVPVLLGALLEGLPSANQFAGFAIALVAVWLISSSPSGMQRVSLRDFQLSGVAGLGFGLLFVFLGQIDETGILWSLGTVRLAAVVTMLLVTLMLRTSKLPGRDQVPLIVFTAMCDTAGDGFYTLAAQAGRLDVAGVLGSLYPAATVLLAWLILREEIHSRQWAGILAMLVAVALISS